ncbi:uncharacterized protein LOC143220195 [Lasioglossum baleicum]|uniref:uncharacterized protein LOC143220195 n=1 Tax=Lasioglossum baleicum TaxID=434251 RepID=UPI003FCD0F1A
MTSQNINNNEKKTLKILQINLNHCKLAQELITQTANQLEADIVIIAEPWSPQTYWYNDGYKGSSIWIPQIGKFSSIHGLYKGNGIVAIQLETYTIVSCYFSPNKTSEEYKERIAELENFLNSIDVNRCIIAGDFNAKSPAWGSSTLDEHGGIIMELCNSCDVIPTLSEGTFTFERNGHKTLIDFMLCGKSVSENISNSRILEEYTASDHRYLMHEFLLNEQNKNNIQKNKKKPNIKAFTRLYTQLTKIADPFTISTTEDIDAYILLLEEIFEDTSYYPKTMKRKEIWWWNKDIAALRKEAIASRRALQRVRSRGKAREIIEVYYNKHKANKRLLK